MVREKSVATDGGKEESSEHQPETDESQPKDVEIGDAREVRFQMRVDSEKYRRIEKVADYAPAEGIITGNHRGNVTAGV